MGISKKLLLTLSLICSFSIQSIEPDDQRAQFLIAKKEFQAAIQAYLNARKKNPAHEPEILRGLAKAIIEEAITSQDTKNQILGLYGLMMSGTHDQDFDFSELIQSSDPNIQMLSIQYLTSWGEDQVESWLNRAMSSYFLPVRLQALGALVQMQSKLALTHIESLYYRLPPFFRPIFAQFYASLGTPDSIKILAQMLSDPDPEMKIASILSICQFQRDDFKEDLRKILTQPDPKVQETAAYAAAHFHDLKSVETLEKMIASSHPNLKLASLIGLNRYYNHRYNNQIFEMATEQNDPYAVFSLGMIDASEPILKTLSRSLDPTIRLNALAGLIEKKDPLAKDLLIEFFNSHSLYDGIAPQFSVGKTLYCLKFYPAFQKQFQKSKEVAHYIEGMTKIVRNRFLIQSLELGESAFLEIAESIFEHDLFDLIPTTVHLLENCHSENSIKKLEKISQKIGSPRSRLYCLISLARMKKESYIQEFFDWISKQQQMNLIELETFDTQDHSIAKQSRFQLSPNENSQLLIDAYETLVFLHDEKCIPILLESIQKMPAQNHPVIAGFLLKGLL